MASLCAHLIMKAIFVFYVLLVDRNCDYSENGILKTHSQVTIADLITNKCRQYTLELSLK